MKEFRKTTKQKMNHVHASANLKLRPCSEADIDLLLNHWTKPAVRRFLFDDRITDRETVAGFVRASATTFKALGFGLWLLADKVTGGFRGVCGFMEKDNNPDLLFSIEPAYWGKGLATESASCVLDYLFQKLNYKQILATVDKPNKVSIMVLEKLGMQLKEEELIQGNPILFYTLTREQYINKTRLDPKPDLTG